MSDCTINYLERKKADAIWLHLVRKYVRIFVPWNCLFRKGYSSHSKSVITSSNCCAAEFRVRISRLWAPRKRLSPRTNIRAYFSASFKCFSWHTRLWKLGNIKPVILLGQSDASENTWWIIRTYHALTHSITWLCKAVHTQKNALVQTSLDFLWSCIVQWQNTLPGVMYSRL